MCRSRIGATAAALTIVDDFLDTEIAAIKAKTDNLPPDPADASDITAAVATLATAANLATLAGYVDTEVAAIKAKTDNLPADTSAVLNTIDDLLDTEIGAIQSSIAALNNGLIRYPETVLFTSHDHQFVETVADRIIEISGNTYIDRKGTYDEFLSTFDEEQLKHM